MIYWSPVALAYAPILILHLVSLGYLLWRRPQSRQTWLFCGWLAGMTLMVATQCAARVVYAPRLSGYLDWWGGVGGVTLALLALLQFAYQYPRPRYPREARWVLGLSLAITGGLFAWMAGEAFTAWPHYVDATALARPDVAFAPSSVWQLYNFERFVYGFVDGYDDKLWVSFKVFNVWQVVGHLWVGLIWARKTVQFSAASPNLSPVRRALRAFRHPQSQEARLSRAWVGLMALSFLPVLASILDGINVLPPGGFALTHLLVLCAVMVAYVNYSPEPTSLMVKLVGITLVTLLMVLGILSDYVLRARQQMYLEARLAETPHLQTLIALNDFTHAPAEVLYVAERPLAGLFADAYQMRFARPGAPSAVQLSAQDALLREGLLHDHFPARVAVAQESPWLSQATFAALGGQAEAIQQTDIPTDVPTYRGVLAGPADHILRYSLVENNRRYEVGYSYAAYRALLHQEALPFLALEIGATLVILGIFPRFFRVGLVAPLVRLLAGVQRIDRGDLRGDLPVLIEDEIGQVTHGFNRMAASLRASEEDRRALNLSLERRVVDRTRDLATVYEITALVNHAQAPDTLLAAALARVTTSVEATAGVILLSDAPDAPCTLKSAYQMPPAMAATITAAALWEQPDVRRSPLLVHDLASDPRLPTPFPYRALLSVPIPLADERVCLLALFGATPFIFNAEALELLETVAKQLGVALANLQLREVAATAAALEERQRLARDLHDSVTQLLYSQQLFADAAAKSLHAGQSDEVAHYLARLSEAAHRALREMRLMLYRLRPSLLAEMGLTGALQRRLELVEQRAGLQTHFACDLDVDLPEDLEAALYYIAEEALNNALKHAAAAEVWVSLTRADDGLTLRIQDNGSGFDRLHTPVGLGMQSMRERAARLGGTMMVESAPGQGTRLVVNFCISEDSSLTDDSPVVG